MQKVLVDTDVLIDFTKGKSKTLKNLLEKQNSGLIELYINPIVIAEFLADKSLKNPLVKKNALEFLIRFRVLQITRKTGILAGEYLHKGVVPSLGDSLIGANCVENLLILCTRNKKDFRKIKKLKIYDEEILEN